MPGWDEFYQEFARRLANHGYNVICPDLYCRVRPRHAGRRRRQGARRRRRGRRPGRRRLRGGDDSGSRRSRPATARSASSAPARAGDTRCWSRRARPAFDAVVDLWGGGVVPAPRTARPTSSRSRRSTSPKDLNAPLLGLFGNDDQCADAGAGRPARGRAEEARQEVRVPPLRRRRATASSTTTGRCTGSSRRWTAGPRSSRSSRRTSKASQQRAELLQPLHEPRPGPAEVRLAQHRHPARAERRAWPASLGRRQDPLHVGSRRTPHQHATTTSGWRRIAASS